MQFFAGGEMRFISKNSILTIHNILIDYYLLLKFFIKKKIITTWSFYVLSIPSLR